jgi:predicted transcriptional regulator
MEMEMTDKDRFDATVQLTAAFMINNSVTLEGLGPVIAKIQLEVDILAGKEPPKVFPAVPVEDSVTDEAIICLEDGKPVVLLKRYLRDHHGMTFEAYLEKWDLPFDYPAVAKSYSEQRSQIAKDQGLGKGKDTPEASFKRS